MAARYFAAARGQKGCYVYFVNEETYVNALPLLDLRAAADSLYESLDGYFAEKSNFKWQLVRGGPFREGPVPGSRGSRFDGA